MSKTKFFLALLLGISLVTSSVAQVNVSGLRRVTTEADDLILQGHSLSLVRQGILSDEFFWPGIDVDDDFVVILLDTFASMEHGRSENHLTHTALAAPSEGVDPTTEPLGPRSSLVQLDSQGISQGYVEVFLVPTGGGSTVNSISESETNFVGEFDVVVDPDPKFCGSKLQLVTKIDMRFSGSPHGALHDGAYFYKRIGKTYLEATYSASADAWIVSGQKIRGNERQFIYEIQYGQNLLATCESIEPVACGDRFPVEEETNFTVCIEANDGDGPRSLLMQFPVINHGTAKLQVK